MKELTRWMYDGASVSAVKLTEEVDVEADVFYPITCGDAKATLVWKKFVCPGINVKCVQVWTVILNHRTCVKSDFWAHFRSCKCGSTAHDSLSFPLWSVQWAAHQPEGVCVFSREIYSEGLEESHPPQRDHAQVCTHQMHSEFYLLSFDTSPTASFFMQHLLHFSWKIKHLGEHRICYMFAILVLRTFQLTPGPF